MSFIIKTLGNGMFGTTYLCKSEDGKLFARKVQKILHTRKTSPIWREIDFFNYIDTLSSANKKFYMQMYSYEIIRDCKHKQILTFKPSGKMAKLVADLDKSKLGIAYDNSYIEGKVLAEFDTAPLSRKQILAFCLQIYKIVFTLYTGGYFHNDTHAANIIATKTTDTYFVIRGHKIPYYGYQLVLIDYGEVASKKFEYNAAEKSGLHYTMFYDEKLHLTNELRGAIFNFLAPAGRLIAEHKKRKLKLPFEKKAYEIDKIIRRILVHSEFVEEVKTKYLKFMADDSSQAITLFNSVTASRGVDFYKLIDFEARKLELTTINKKLIKAEFWLFVDILINELTLRHPLLFKKYFGWCTVGKFLLDYEDVEHLLYVKNYEEMFNALMHLFKH